MNNDFQTAAASSIPSGVGATAVGVAASRAVATNRARPLIRDDFAVRFVESARADGSAVASLLESDDENWLALCTNVEVRTHDFDAYLHEAIASGVAQVVLLGAGLDTRAFRLSWSPEVTCFELDQPDVLDFKLQVLRDCGATATCAYRPLGCDLRDDWAAVLLAAGFDRSQPTVWLAEGLFTYLPPDAEQRLFDIIHAMSAPGSRICAHYIDDMSAVLGDRVVPDALGSSGIQISKLVHTGPRRDSQRIVQALSWTCRTESVTSSATRHGLTLPNVPFDHFIHLFAELRTASEEGQP